MNTTELAKELGLSKGRISQYVSEGKLDGCFTGAGRARRFNVDKVRAVLEQRLDPGQMLGNGAETKRRLRDGEAAPEATEVTPAVPKRDGQLPRNDPDRYELARIQKVEEEARRLRRQNMLEEGSVVLADKAAREATRALSRELAQVEDFLRRAARAIADELGVDFKEARKLVIDLWREHRGARAEAMAEEAAVATMDAEEDEVDF
ncbi:helix-turn-helix domain-containing protein [Salipiger mangrovisoli]|uniref:Helix-turn-helix domain-containing protein n=1 Tax=Salipiger mangrovisoli TaxID=2865933 RepID=A0ABR9WWW2_9RHOB|nr:helix-turn-helix domain-containing protein [Salipiger mangrovisoli]MBE9635768.1 helix-turn-helix domain-containing protein [Salipiger mangrovisoli]